MLILNTENVYQQINIIDNDVSALTQFILRKNDEKL